jgi:leader peptidase (prepilin peptidase)/N-methyltransferase
LTALRPIIGTTGVARGSLVAVAFVVGLAVGSFLNVVVYRVPRGLSVVQPRSFCPSCRTPLRSVDNVPLVSWLVLRGRCRFCGAAISVRYPLVELATGVVFGLLALALGAQWAVLGMCALGGTLLALTVIEIDGLPPPPPLALTGTALGAALLVGAAAITHDWWRLGGMLIGIGVAAVLLVATPRVGHRRPPRERPWSLLPAAAMVGWLGPVACAVGVASAVVLLLATTRGRRTPENSAPVRWALVCSVASAVAVASAAIAGTAT